MQTQTYLASSSIENKNKFQCLATGSSGNCYLVNLGGGYIILDAGVSIRTINAKVNLNDVVFACITHEHNDHKQSMGELLKRRVQVFYGGANEKLIKRTKKGHTIYQVPVEHGDTINNAFIIQYENECLLYATDFNICKYDLSQFKFTHVIVECNYYDSLMKVVDIKTKRQINTHMGLEGLKLFLDGLDLSECKEIDLVHLSQGYGNPVMMGASIYSKYKIRTGVCRQWGGVNYYGRG